MITIKLLARLSIVLFSIVLLSCGGGGGGGDSESVPAGWFKTYGGVYPDSGKSVKQTSDGGYIIVGSTKVDQGGYDAYLIKTDSTGKTLWTKTYGGPGNDSAGSVQQTTDGGYIVLGEFMVGSNKQMWLIKTDSHGNNSWDRFFGFDNSQEDGAEVQQTADGGYILIGTSQFADGSGAQAFIVKTDGNGNTQWYREKGYDDSNERGTSIRQTADGGYILTGATFQFDKVWGDVWLVKLNATGGTSWHQHYGGSFSDNGTSVRQTNDGGYIISGNTGPYAAGDLYMLKTDSVGNQQWARTFGGTDMDLGAEIQQTKDGGYIITGTTQSYGKGLTDCYLIKTNAAGEMLWDNTFGGNDSEWCYSVQQTSDGGYIMTGSTQSGNEGYPSDVYLVKTDQAGSSLP